MKKFLSFILVLTMVLVCIPFTAGSVKAEAAELPSAVDLRDSDHLPQVGDQGGVGCCASMAATYMQYSNAFSRYAEANGIAWGKPGTADPAYNFSPRFTYNLAGSGTAWVYEIIKEQGVPTQNYSSFTNGVTGSAPDDDRANDWATQEGIWNLAQNYRLNNYDQVWVKDACNFQITTSVAGQVLINRIKEHLNKGNVVVTGGYASSWVTDAQLNGGGSIGSVGDYALPYTLEPLSGGHQVSVIGYDDNITCNVNGVTLKGGFLVANSWGGWKNNGCIWVMYDALNEVSEYPALNVPNRTWTMDQFVFLDWENDIEYGTPELVTELSFTVANRDDLTVTLTRTDIETGEIAEYTPYMFGQEFARPRQNVNFYGNTDNGYNLTTGFLAFNYNKLTESIPAGKTIQDYMWGASITADSTASNNAMGDAVTVHTTRLYQNGNKIYENTPVYHIAAGDSQHVLLSNDCLVITDKPTGTIINTENSNLCTSGETYSFTISAESGYMITNALTVKVNGKEIFPDIYGTYSFTVSESTFLYISGIVPNKTTVGGFYTYGNGAEINDGEEVFVLGIPTTLPADVTDSAALQNGNYRYTFRFTVNGTDVYDFTPFNFYDNWLCRIDVVNQGWIPINGRNYTLKVDVCIDGIPAWSSEEFPFNYAANCNVIYTTSGMHTHSYTSGAYIYLDKGSCCTIGHGYEYCSHAGCSAITEKDLPATNTGHLVGGEPFVSKNATASLPGELAICCQICQQSIHYGYFTAPQYDCSGDNQVTIDDITLLLNYLSMNGVEADSIACGTDINTDGKNNIKDVTHLLLVLNGSIS